tara:strand:- start:1414 stop:1536 length:123 start_codon:yes stop_codon:yes gene_type:complete
MEMNTCPICTGKEAKSNYLDGSWRTEGQLCKKHTSEVLSK